MQISYHSTLTKIQKLQNLKKKKKNSVLARIARNWPVFKPVQNVDVLILVYVSVWYISADMASTGIVLTTLFLGHDIFFYLLFHCA